MKYSISKKQMRKKNKKFEQKQKPFLENTWHVL